MSISLRLIEQTLVLGETGNFARAAERLGITQPTLTRKIATLELNLGVRLFDRGRGGAVNSLDTAKQVARRSDALFPGSVSMLAAASSRGELVRLDFDGSELRTHVALVRAVESELIAAERASLDGDGMVATSDLAVRA